METLTVHTVHLEGRLNADDDGQKSKQLSLHLKR